MAKTKPFFSIIIPTLNEEKYLPFLLADLRRQTFKDFETLVVDAQSVDNTPQICRRAKRVVFLTTAQANVGHQRNLGAQKATGKYFIFIDADTRLPYYFLEGLKYRISLTKPDLFTAWMNQETDNHGDKAIITLINFLLEASKFLETPGAFGAMLGCKRTVFSRVGGFDPTITFAEDTELVQRATKQGFTFALFKDPRFTFSLRRFRKEGTLPAVRNITKLHLDWVINGFPKKPKKEYPMLGGSYYQTKKPYPQFLRRFEKTVAKIKKLKNKQTLRRFIETFFSD